jgi:hypothetical protein
MQSGAPGLSSTSRPAAKWKAANANSSGDQLRPVSDPLVNGSC